MAYRSKIGPSKSSIGVDLDNIDNTGDFVLTLDGSGNGAFDVSLPPCIVRGIRILLGTATSVPFTLANMGRTITAATATTSQYYPSGELLDTAAGTASTSYGQGGAFVNGDVTFTVAGGTAGGTVRVQLFYED
jgi:hypothetical protein